MRVEDVSIEKTLHLISQADAVIVAAGAGMSVDSGLPDYRGADGFWKAYPGLGERRLSFIEMATPQRFKADPVEAWGFYGHQINLYRPAQPHAGYAALLELGSQVKHGIGVYTSNVDGLFAKAGFDASRLVECHGSVHRLQCSKPCSDHVWTADTTHFTVDEKNIRLLSELPTCPNCGAVARPNVMLFHDDGCVEVIKERQRASFDEWIGRATRPLLIEIGSSSAVPTVRAFGLQMKRTYGAAIVRINPDPTPWIEDCDAHIQLGARDALVELAARVAGYAEA